VIARAVFVVAGCAGVVFALGERVWTWYRDIGKLDTTPEPVHPCLLYDLRHERERRTAA
jgi:hypothetical protein